MNKRTGASIRETGPKHPDGHQRWMMLLAYGWPLILGANGCALVNNPFRDELAHQQPVTTASVDAIRASAAPEQMAVRNFELMYRYSEDGSVVHLPTWFEDPYEENGSEDGKFAWTAEDYWQMVYWRGRFLVEAAIWPVSAIVEPPWREMVSDGNLEKRGCGELHDVKTLHSYGKCTTSSITVTEHEKTESQTKTDG